MDNNHFRVFVDGLHGEELKTLKCAASTILKIRHVQNW